MLSYRHGFHAGNHADVIKHLVLSESLRYLVAKPSPLRYIDTHAGPGACDLGRGYSARTEEYRDGIGRLWEARDFPEPVRRLVDIVRAVNPEGRLERYPGSPLVAAAVLRREDRGFLYEMHPADATELRAGLGADRRFRIGQTDGLAALKGLLPPPSRRAFVLVDPPYERDEEYDAVLEAVDDARIRFPGGCYAVWYPVLAKDEARFLPERILSLGRGARARLELLVRKPPDDGWGMYGSGFAILNPPWGLKAVLEESLSWLAKTLGNEAQGHTDFSWDEK
ncbi:MAG: 23S rRNA (adenine(2030)-N(6))-methyltransferase RlmJ [Spirochaetales bacterium]|nr:23S rRNA (adenine(2030)-N(6))-methyltransferase RlmJ [Spirochaetales bacterium]